MPCPSMPAPAFPVNLQPSAPLPSSPSSRATEQAALAPGPASPHLCCLHMERGTERPWALDPWLPHTKNHAPERMREWYTRLHALKGWGDPRTYFSCLG